MSSKTTKFSKAYIFNKFYITNNIHINLSYITYFNPDEKNAI